MFGECCRPLNAFIEAICFDKLEYLDLLWLALAYFRLDALLLPTTRCFALDWMLHPRLHVSSSSICLALDHIPPLLIRCSMSFFSVSNLVLSVFRAFQSYFFLRYALLERFKKSRICSDDLNHLFRLIF